ncbi:MAG TPA: hypothetical protein VHQ47_07735, partial [Phycisphaerae bacterium]|nr:hypothetical protein [Phycisphaerae bacterium]
MLPTPSVHPDFHLPLSQRALLPQSHLWFPYIPRGQLTLLAAHDPAAATALALHFAAQTSRRLPLGPDPDDRYSLPAPHANALASPVGPPSPLLVTFLLSPLPPVILTDRLRDLHADLDFIHALQPSSSFYSRLVPSLDSLFFGPDPDLLIIDPLLPTCSPLQLADLAVWAESIHAAVLLVAPCHKNLPPNLPLARLRDRARRALPPALLCPNAHLLLPAPSSAPDAPATHLFLPLQSSAQTFPPPLA